MADIQTPNGLEVNEALVGATDEMEVYQPASGGIRRNKYAFLNTLKTFFQIITGGVLNNIVSFGAGGAIHDSGVGLSDISDNATAIGLNTTHRGSTGVDHSHVVLNSKGLNQVVLTQYNTTAIPAIAVDSVCEINGSLYTNPLEIVISGATANTTWYDILLTPAGTTFTASFIARGTGAWSDSKHGLYSGNNRVVACAYRDSAVDDWINKNVLIVNNRTIKVKMQIGDWNMDTTPTVNIIYGLDITKIRNINVMIRNDFNGESIPFVQSYYIGGIAYYGGRAKATGVNIELFRIASTDGGFFDGGAYDSTPFNRGDITIDYEV